MALDGARPVFRHLPAPTATERAVRVQQIAARIGIALQRRGLIERDIENTWLAGEGPGGVLDDLIGHASRWIP